MSEAPRYTKHHPRWLRPKMSTYWWLQHRSYLSFTLRELSSLFVAWFVVYLLFLIRAVSQGEEGYRQFLDWSGHPLILLLNLVSLLFILLHAITWFNAAPQALSLRVAGKRVPDFWITASNYLGLIVASALVAWLLLSG